MSFSFRTAINYESCGPLQILAATCKQSEMHPVFWLIWLKMACYGWVYVQAGGFIASHLAKRLKSEGHHLICADWKRNSHMSVSTYHLPVYTH